VGPVAAVRGAAGIWRKTELVIPPVAVIRIIVLRPLKMVSGPSNTSSPPPPVLGWSTPSTYGL
jgi:hypothetical protein